MQTPVHTIAETGATVAATFHFAANAEGKLFSRLQADVTE